MLQHIMTPELIFFGGLFACGLAVITLLLAGRSALSQGLATRLSVLETQIEDRKKTLQDMGMKLAEKELLETQTGQLEKRLEALQHELKPFEEKYLKAVSQYEEIKGKLRQSKEDWAGLAERIELYNSRISQIDTLEQQIKELSAYRQQIEEDVRGMQAQLTQVQQLDRAINQKTQEYQNLEKESQALKEAVTAEKETLAQAQEKVRQAEESLQQRKDELNRLENIKIDLDARLETLSDKLKNVGKMPAEAFASLYTPVFDPHLPVGHSKDEMAALERLERLIEYCGFEIPRRLQDAFHTALKTSDISCLTVMAGVSGTGKSAFPKLYAEALGMHFLPLAVEPRWDSPQDLFGFLNYMENRFEATTLGRALMQFNNSPHAPESASMRDKMLLVMLDEMNLARIEYYFSEFLSKLEMRRNANLNQEKDYRMVSVEIFPGQTNSSDGESSPAVRLFAGSNVLFVGTMNEDESTQSLSDKVIDRANVLYFGRPDKLRDKRQNVTETRAWQPLGFDNWMSWITEPNSTSIPEYERIDKLINSINQTLARLGRPFGWRTYKAIKAYIANHPAVRFRENDGLSPLADQIAMRVMPKLRGVDLGQHGEVFSSLGQMLQQVNDQGLREAFDLAAQSSQGFFDWRGINWGK